jgi:hypothetical protein
LRAQDWPPEALELVCVDDGSSDATPRIAAALADRVIRPPGSPLGPAAARNAGAAVASGEILIFLDADVVAPPGVVAGLARPLLDEPDLDAVFGSYDAEPLHDTLVSAYRNLLHHYVHQTSSPEAQTFWAGCGAVRRAAFERLRGFDGARYPRPSIEDIELGRRMRAAGMRIRLVPEVQVKHLKRWTVADIVRTDVLARGVPWARLLLDDWLGRRGAAIERDGWGAKRRGSPDVGAGPRGFRGGAEIGDLNLRPAAIASAPLAWAAVLLLPGALRQPKLLAWSAGLAALVAALGAPLTLFFWRARGPAFALATLPLQFLYHLGNGLSVALAVAERLGVRGPRRSRSGPPPGAPPDG